MTEFGLVRHGTTEWNLLGVLQGWTDVPLSALGRAEMLDLARKLVGMGFEAIYSSDLLRARQSAMVISMILGLPIHLDCRLREIGLGVWEGLRGQRIRELYPRELAESGIDGAPGGERLSRVARRMQMVANDVAEAYPGSKVLLVGHGTALKTLIFQAEGRPLTSLTSDSFPNASLRFVHWEEPSRKSNANECFYRSSGRN